jgi:hypothetical protein
MSCGVVRCRAGAHVSAEVVAGSTLHRVRDTSPASWQEQRSYVMPAFIAGIRETLLATLIALTRREPAGPEPEAHAAG